VIAAGAGGWWVARRALRPVARMTDEAAEIGMHRLDERIEVPDTADELARLAETLNGMLDRLEQGVDERRRFTADASHELRSPLATMRGAIDVALSRPRKAEEYRRVLASAGEDVDRLRSITEDLLLLARADAGRVTVERNLVRLDLIGIEVAESFAAAAAQQGIVLETRCAAPILVLGDERWLRQLAFNLLDNALKFSAPQPQSGSAKIAIEVTHGNGVAQLAVTDSGPGIPPEAVDHMFERFYRADSARPYRGAEGFGLGLAIASWIVEAHGGTIAARNRTEGGAAVSVVLPCPRSK